MGAIDGSVDRGRGRLAYACVDLRPEWAVKRDSPAIVLQHGLGLTKECWRPWLRYLMGDRAIVAIDLRGHGGSAAAWEGRRYEFPDFADDVIAVVDHLGISRFHFVGESFGGMVGLDLAAHMPHRVASLSLCSTPYRGQFTTNNEHWSTMVHNEGMAAWSTEFIHARFPAGSVSRDLVIWLHEMQSQLAPAVVTGLVDIIRSTDLAPEAECVRAPTLIIVPAGSPFISVELQEQLHACVALSEIMFLRDAMHGVILSHAPVCATAVASFIERADDRARYLVRNPEM